jgi:hypothetical protein
MHGEEPAVEEFPLRDGRIRSDRDSEEADEKAGTEGGGRRASIAAGEAAPARISRDARRVCEICRVKFAGNNLSAGASFEETMRTVIGAVLATPDFLYFYKSRGDNEAERSRRVADF